MKLLLLLPFLLLLLPACASLPEVRNITWAKVPKAEIEKVCGVGNIACAKWHPDQKWCQITTHETSNEHLEWGMLGHEVKHCFLGNFHPEKQPL